MKEKKLAIELLETAIQRVNDAMEAIVKFAEDFDIEPEKEELSVEDIVKLVHEETGIPAACVKKVIEATIDILTEVDDDDEC